MFYMIVPNFLNVTKRIRSTDHLPTSFFQCSYRMTPYACSKLEVIAGIDNFASTDSRTCFPNPTIKTFILLHSQDFPIGVRNFFLRM